MSCSLNAQTRKKRKAKREKKKNEEATGTKIQKGIPDGIKVELGKYCQIPLKDQLFPHEWQALQDLKTNYEICKNYSDEFLMASLFSRKLELVRTHTLLQNNWKWRKDNNLVELPKLADINIEGLLHSWLIIPGARTKDGYGLTCFEIGTMEIGKEPWSHANLTKWFVWYYTIGIFVEGMDYLRNGVVIVEDLDGFGWKHVDLEFNKKMSSMWTDTFPMRVKKFS